MWTHAEMVENLVQELSEFAEDIGIARFIEISEFKDGGYGCEFNELLDGIQEDCGDFSFDEIESAVDTVISEYL